MKVSSALTVYELRAMNRCEIREREKAPASRRSHSAENAADSTAGGGARDDVHGVDLFDGVDDHGGGVGVDVAEGVDREAEEAGVLLGSLDEVPEPVVAGHQVELGANGTAREAGVAIVAGQIAHRSTRVGAMVDEGACALKEWSGLVEELS
jgi:hypothetical protein